MDWICKNCETKNEAHQSCCYVCGALRDEANTIGLDEQDDTSEINPPEEMQREDGKRYAAINTRSKNGNASELLTREQLSKSLKQIETKFTWGPLLISVLLIISILLLLWSRENPDLIEGAEYSSSTETLETLGQGMNSIVWSDAFLENGIRKALGKNADQEISPEELASINTLTILGDTIVINDRAFWEGYGDVKDVVKIDGHDKSYFGFDPYHPEQSTGTMSLQDLKYFPNLESLNLLSISIQDLKGINNCKNLKNLRVHECNGFSFAVLSREVPLQEVYIWCQQDVNVKDLLGIDQLELLDIYCSPLDGTEYLAELTSLQHLGLYWSGGSNLTDVEFLYQLPNLTFLSLGEDYVEDIAPISALTHLKSLYLSRGVLDDQDMKNISRLTGLVHFGADALGWDDGLQSPLEDLSFLRNLTDLEDISLEYCDVEIGALTPLENLDNLRSLSLEGAFFTSDSDYGTLSKLTGLRELNLKGNSIVDMDIISKFTSLEILDLSDTDQKDWIGYTKLYRKDKVVVFS